MTGYLGDKLNDAIKNAHLEQVVLKNRSDQ
jgi:hypothetical protein